MAPELLDNRRARRARRASPTPPRPPPAATGSGPRSVSPPSGHEHAQRLRLGETPRAPPQRSRESADRARAASASRGPPVAAGAQRPLERQQPLGRALLSSSSRLIPPRLKPSSWSSRISRSWRVLGPVVADAQPHLRRRQQPAGLVGADVADGHAGLGGQLLDRQLVGGSGPPCGTRLTFRSPQLLARSSLPDSVRGSSSSELDRLRHLEARPAARRRRRAAPPGPTGRPSCSTTVATTASPHSGSAAPEHAGVERRPGARAAPPRPPRARRSRRPVTIVSALRPTISSAAALVEAPRSPVCSQPSLRARPGATIGPRTSISPSAPTTSSTPGSGQPKVAICEHASVIPYVGATGTPAARRALEQRRRDRAAAEQRPAQRRRTLEAGVEQPREHRRHERDERDPPRRRPSARASTARCRSARAGRPSSRRSRCGSGSTARRRARAASGTASARPGRARARPPSRARSPASCRSVSSTGLGAAVVPEVCITATAIASSRNALRAEPAAHAAPRRPRSRPRPPRRALRLAQPQVDRDRRPRRSAGSRAAPRARTPRPAGSARATRSRDGTPCRQTLRRAPRSARLRQLGIGEPLARALDRDPLRARCAQRGNQ